MRRNKRQRFTLNKYLSLIINNIYTVYILLPCIVTDSERNQTTKTSQIKIQNSLIMNTLTILTHSNYYIYSQNKLENSQIDKIKFRCASSSADRSRPRKGKRTATMHPRRYHQTTHHSQQKKKKITRNPENFRGRTNLTRLIIQQVILEKLINVPRAEIA